VRRWTFDISSPHLSILFKQIPYLCTFSLQSQILIDAFNFNFCTVLGDIELFFWIRGYRAIIMYSFHAKRLYLRRSNILVKLWYLSQEEWWLLEVYYPRFQPVRWYKKSWLKLLLVDLLWRKILLADKKIRLKREVNKLERPAYFFMNSILFL